MSGFSPAQVAEHTGFSLDTLRYYEKAGLLGRIERTAGGHRLYTQSDVDWLGMVRCLRDTGMPISELKRYVELSADDATIPDRIALLQEHDRSVQASIDDLKRQQRRVREKIAYYRELLAAT
jgi:DNA-binding transcriptional MerR regulator